MNLHRREIFPPRRIKKREKHCAYAGISVLFVVYWVVFVSFNPREQFLTTTVSKYHYTNLEHGRGGNANVAAANLRRASANNNNNNNNIKTLGQRIVETSYRSAGFEDFATEFCPSQSTPVQPSRFKKDYLISCLDKAKQAGNQPGTKFHDRWPWWFRTLLRDLVGHSPSAQIVGPWHYLQFKDVRGLGASDSSSPGGEDVPRRLQMCTYEKGGSKSWKKLQCEHNHDYSSNRTKGIDFSQCWRKMPPYDEILLHSITGGNDRDNNNNSTAPTAYESEKVVFLRDPLDRFLSGFLDKCIGKIRQGHCEPISVFAESPNTNRRNKDANTTTTTPTDTTLKSPIETLLWDKRRTFQAYVDTFPLTWNMHFFPQSFYCGGLHRTIDSYDFVGSMGDSFHQDLDAMQNRYPGLKPGMEKIFNLTTKLSSSSSTTNKGIETGAAKQVLEYYTPHTVRRVLEYYSIDYQLLGLPIPEWAEEMLLQTV